MEITFKDYEYKNQKLCFTIKEKDINGITGNHLDDFISLMRLDNFYQKGILVNKKELKEKDYLQLKKKISLVKERIDNDIHEETIEELMIDYMKYHEVYPKKLQKKLKDALKIVGLEESLLKRNIYRTSSSEQKLIQIALELLLNPEVIILEEPLRVLDMKNRKKIMMVLNRIKEEYQKAIIIVSSDPEILYKETNHLIIFKNDKILMEKETAKVYQDVEFLRKHKIDMPEIVEFTYLAKKNKKAKIDYFRDIRDLIKDIYKHV